MRGGRFALWLTALLVIGFGLRLAVILGPLGEIEGDEAVVGMMARHIAFLGERPVFYWGQEYLGTLEQFSAAALFRIFDSSTLLLKLVPTAYSLGFLWLSALVARRLFGNGPALATAAYLALPPSMWAVWSQKARGGYAELLFVGEALLLVTLWLAARPSVRGALVWGLLGGLALWSHLLAVVYLIPCLAYLMVIRLTRCRGSLAEAGIAGAGFVLGVLPLLVYNVAKGWPTVQALADSSGLPPDRVAQFVRFFRVGVPVLVGLGQPTTSPTLFDNDWLLRPAGYAPIAMAALLLLAGAVLVHWRSVWALVRPRAPVCCAEPAVLVLLALIVPPTVAMSQFGFFVSEVRYALPLYSVVPLLAGAVWKIPDRLQLARLGVALGVLAVNVWSLLSTDIRLWRPEDAIDSTAATRAELASYLLVHNRRYVYTDYWIAYPIMFETREAIAAYVISAGFNRYLQPAIDVQRASNPAWVFVSGSKAEAAFVQQLRGVDGRAAITDVSIFRVYTDIEPLTQIRPPD